MGTAWDQRELGESIPNPNPPDGKGWLPVELRWRTKFEVGKEGHLKRETFLPTPLGRDPEALAYPSHSLVQFSNFWAYECSHHQAISVCLAHPLHPFTSNERLVVMFCSFAFTFMMTALLRVSSAESQEICDIGCDEHDHFYWQGFCGPNPVRERKKIRWYITNILT